jgi:hypothetical protein
MRFRFRKNGYEAMMATMMSLMHMTGGGSGGAGTPATLMTVVHSRTMPT